MGRKKKKKKRRATRSAENKLSSRRRSSDIHANRSLPSMEQGGLTTPASVTEAPGGVSDNFSDPRPGVLPRKPRLSVCMIVRDEEKVLPRCLRSVQGIADELIVVDTGSQDNTISIAKDFGAKVSHFRWCDDFAAARNECLKYATGDWILHIDADEELRPDSIPHLKKGMLSSFVLYYLIKCDNGPRCEGVRIEWVGRLFRRHPELRYHRPYIEGVDCSVEKVIIAEPRWQKRYEPNIIIHHCGYEPSKMPKKWERGIRIMKSYIIQNPNDAYILTRLGGVCCGLGRYGEAEAYLNRALKINPHRPMTHYNLGLALQGQKKMEAAMRCYTKVITTDPDFAVAYVNLGGIYVQTGMLDNAISELRRALAIDPDMVLGHNMLGLAYSKKGMLDEAISEFKRVLAINPNLGGAHNNLALAYYIKKQYELAIRHCDKALELEFKVDPGFLQALKARRWA